MVAEEAGRAAATSAARGALTTTVPSKWAGSRTWAGRETARVRTTLTARAAGTATAAASSGEVTTTRPRNPADSPTAIAAPRQMVPADPLCPLITGPSRSFSARYMYRARSVQLDTGSLDSRGPSLAVEVSRWAGHLQPEFRRRWAHWMEIGCRPVPPHSVADRTRVPLVASAGGVAGGV